jgi:hypothetical protein
MMTYGSYLLYIKLSRCGVIPYVFYNNQLYYLFARHKDSNVLSDFGGGVKREETALFGGLREFYEESKGIFGEITLDKVNTSLSIIDGNNMGIIFIPLDYKWVECAQNEFNNKIMDEKYYDEVSELIWIDDETLQKLIYANMGNNETYLSFKREKLWVKIQTFFRKFYGSKMKFFLKIAAVNSKKLLA